jgi:hypothetical protein
MAAYASSAPHANLELTQSHANLRGVGSLDSEVPRKHIAHLISKGGTSRSSSFDLVFPLQIPSKHDPLPKPKRKPLPAPKVPTQGEIDCLEDSRMPTVRASKSMRNLSDGQGPISRSSFDLGQENHAAKPQLAGNPTVLRKTLDQIEMGNVNRGLPEFRQSRRWANFQTASELKSRNLETSDEEKMTLRQASFEQQRAQRKTSLQHRNSVPVSAAIAISETDSLMQATGLCGSISLPMWHLLRSAHPKHLPSKWANRKSPPKRHRRSSSKVSETSSITGAGVSPRKLQLRRRVRPKKAVADLRRTAGFGSRVSKLDEVDKIVNLDDMTSLDCSEKAKSSSLPSLHDAKKAKRFSQECEALLSNSDFDRYWLITAERTSVLADESSTRPIPSSRKKVSKLREKAAKKQQTSSTNSEPHPGTLCTDLEGLQASDAVAPGSEPTAQSSAGSKASAKIASIIQLTKTSCMPALSSFRDGSIFPFNDSSSTIAPNRVADLDSPTQMSSRMAKSSQGIPGLRSVGSNDTLSQIEAQMQDSTRAIIADKLGQNTAFIVASQPRPNSGTPPERPLPDLPPSDEGQRNPSSSPIDPKPESAMRVAESPPMLSNKSSRRTLQDIAASRGLKIHPITTQVIPQEPSPALPTPSSTYSQPSHRSRPSISLSVPFPRHDLSQLRPDRVRGLKQRVQTDLARERHITEEDESSASATEAAGNKIKPSVPSEAKTAADPINNFPSVPLSRSESRASFSHGRNPSTSRGHARHSSKASSIRPAMVRQILGTSEIKVLVDTNPVTGLFRAGALIPSPSLVGNGHEGSPARSRRNFSATCIKIDELSTGFDQSKKVSASKRPSIRSLRSQSSSHIPVLNTTSTARSLLRGPEAKISDSDDEVYPLLSSALAKSHGSGPMRQRRRTNSTDLQKAQLESFYKTIIRLERELRMKREEIHETMKGLNQTIDTTHQKHQKSASVGMARLGMMPDLDLDRERAEASSILARELKSLDAARSKKGRPREKACKNPPEPAATMTGKEEGDALRPVSHVSSTSATTNASAGTDEQISREGSMTDPQEYELQPTKCTTPTPTPTPNSTHSRSHIATPNGSISKESLALSLNRNLKAKIKNDLRAGVQHDSRSGPQPERTPTRLGNTNSKSADLLHAPPSVPTMLPKGKLAEEDDDDGRSTLRSKSERSFYSLIDNANSTSNSKVKLAENEQKSENSKGNGIGIGNKNGTKNAFAAGTLKPPTIKTQNQNYNHSRLSLNHGLTDTKQMDAAIEALRSLG